MASYVTRAERSGNIFSRVTGLIRSGQLKWDERPLWYDVYVSSPPLTPPDWNVKLAKHGEPIRSIFYEEDLLRSKFYKRFRNTAAIQVNSRKTSISQQFINEYKVVASEGKHTSDEQIFDATINRMRENGLNLK